MTQDTDNKVQNGEEAVAELVRIQPLISEDAARRLRIEAARRGQSQGEVITDLILAQLPESA